MLSSWTHRRREPASQASHHGPLRRRRHLRRTDTRRSAGRRTAARTGRRKVTTKRPTRSPPTRLAARATALTRTTTAARTRRPRRRGLRPGLRRGGLRRPGLDAGETRFPELEAAAAWPRACERGRGAEATQGDDGGAIKNQERHGAAGGVRGRNERRKDRDSCGRPTQRASPDPRTPGGGLTGDSLPDINNAAARIPEPLGSLKETEPPPRPAASRSWMPRRSSALAGRRPASTRRDEL